MIEPSRASVLGVGGVPLQLALLGLLSGEEALAPRVCLGTVALGQQTEMVAVMADLVECDGTDVLLGLTASAELLTDGVATSAQIVSDQSSVDGALLDVVELDAVLPGDC